MLPHFSEGDNLLLALKEGNIAAFEHLYKHYKYWMLLEAFLILKDDLAAQDLVQDLMIDFWQDKLYKNIQGSIKGYLLTAVRNRAYNYVRDNRRKERKQAAFIKMHLAPLNEYENSEINISLQTAIDNLPPRTHAVFIHFYFDGLSQRKIAEIMKISPNTVNNHIENARKQIRRALKKS